MTDPRILRTRRLVTREALAELAAEGYGAFAMESVATRSGVAKSTIYRHWPSKLALIADALETLNVQPATEGESADSPGESTVVDPMARIHQLLVHLAEAFRDPTITGSTPALIEASEHDDAVRAFHHGYALRRRQALVDALATGVREGVLPGHVDPELASLALAGAIIYRRVMTADPFDPAEVPALVATVLGPHLT